MWIPWPHTLISSRAPSENVIVMRFSLKCISVSRSWLSETRPRPRTGGLQDAFSGCWLSHSSVDLSRRQAAGSVDLEGEEVWGLLPGTPSTDKSAFSHPSSLQLFYPPPSPWPQLLGEGVFKPTYNYSFQGARWTTTASTTNSKRDSQALSLPQSFHPQPGSREKLKLWWRRGGVGLQEAAFQIFLKLAFKI